MNERKLTRTQYAHMPWDSLYNKKLWREGGVFSRDLTSRVTKGLPGGRPQPDSNWYFSIEDTMS
jgi:hypothetical protein